MPVPSCVPSTQGVEVAVHDLGGDGPPMIFCHPTGFHGRVWIPTANHLTDTYHCIALDFRGHGATELPPTADLEWASIASDLLAVIEAISPDEPIRAVGHSLGGGCIALAALAAPNSILKAWAFEPILFGTGTDIRPSPLAEGARRRRRNFESIEAAIERYASRPPMNQLDPEALDAYVRYGFKPDADGGVTLCCAPETEAQVFDNHAAGSLDAALKMTVPYALVAGTDDDGPGWLSRDAAPRSEHLTLFEMELSHFGPMEDPKMVADAIRSWFAT